MKRSVFLVAVMAMMTLNIQAQQVAVAPLPQRQNVPAYRGLIERTQPNGYVLRTYLRGDEHKHWTMTEDGWQLLENKKGWLVYATQKKDGTIVASNKKARNAEDRKKCEVKWLNKKGIKKSIE